MREVGGCRWWQENNDYMLEGQHGRILEQLGVWTTAGMVVAMLE